MSPAVINKQSDGWSHASLKGEKDINSDTRAALGSGGEDAFAQTVKLGDSSIIQDPPNVTVAV